MMVVSLAAKPLFAGPETTVQIAAFPPGTAATGPVADY